MKRISALLLTVVFCSCTTSIIIHRYPARAVVNRCIDYGAIKIDNELFINLPPQTTSVDFELKSGKHNLRLYKFERGKCIEYSELNVDVKEHEKIILILTPEI